MECRQARPLFAAYLDGAAGKTFDKLREHLSQCSTCVAEFNVIENTRQLVNSLGRKPASQDLNLKIREALSRQRNRTWRNILQTYAVRAEDFFSRVSALVKPVLSAITRLFRVRGSVPTQRAVNREKPPALPKFLILLIPKKIRENILGDLEEEYRTIVLPEYGMRKAQFWYWAQALWVILPVLWQRMRKLAGVALLWKLLR